jgi:hypothetical protein
MASPQIELGKQLTVTVAAAGLAWLRVWKEIPDLFLHHTDHSHPNHKGSIISAMVLYAAITGGTPMALSTSVPIDCYGTPCSEVTPAESDVFRRAAWEEAKATSLE